MSEWTREPWQWIALETTVGDDPMHMHAELQAPRTTILSAEEVRVSDAARIVACVNACAGIRDPAEAIEKAKKALRESARIIENLGNASDIELAKEARAALAALENEE